MPVNNYRWFRGFNDYDNWQASGVSGAGRAIVLLPAEVAEVRRLPHAARSPRTIRRRRTARSARIASPAANTALPFVNGDPSSSRRCRTSCATARSRSTSSASSAAPRRAGAGVAAPRSRDEPRTVEHVRGRRGVDELRRARRRSSRTPAEVVAPLDKVDADGPARRIGPRRGRRAHAQGRPLLPGRHGGRVRRLGRARGGRRARAGRSSTAARSTTAGKGPVEPGAHFYRSLLLDEHGNPINKRNAWATRSVAYVRLIPPGAADTIHYRLQIPPDAGDTITLQAKVNYRKFAWWNTQWAFAGVRDPEHAGLRRSAAATTTASGCSPATRRTCPAR